MLTKLVNLVYLCAEIHPLSSGTYIPVFIIQFLWKIPLFKNVLYCA